MTAREHSPAPDTADHDRHAERIAGVVRDDFHRKLAQLVPDPVREQEIEQKIEQRERSNAVARAGLVRERTANTAARIARATQAAPGRSTGNAERSEDSGPTLASARAEAEVLAALAFDCWGAAHDDAGPPAQRVPSVETLTEWIAESNGAVFDALAARSAALARAALQAYGLHSPGLEDLIERRELVTALNALARTLPPGSTIDPDNHLADTGGTLVVVREPLPAAAVDLAQWIEAVHALWCEYGASAGSTHPLVPLVAAWQELAPVPACWDGRDNPVLPAPLATVRHVRPASADQVYLPFDWDTLGAVSVDDPDDQAWLPGLEPSSSPLVPALPLVLWDGSGGLSMAQGRGAPLALRLWIEAMLAVPSGERHWHATRVTCTLRDLLAGLWPHGSYRRGKDLPKLMSALRLVDQARIAWANGRQLWRAVSLTSVPASPALDDPIVFDVSLPPGSGQGPLIHRPTLRHYGVESAPAYRAYLSLCWYWDRYGTVNGSMIGATRPEVGRDKAGYVLDARGNVVTEHGQPTRRATHLKAVHTGRREPNPSAIQYPVLSPDDLVRMCYPDVAMSASGRRVQALRARETLETMQGDGVVALVEAEDGSGKRGVRVPVADAHRERHEALRAVRERRRRRRSTGNAERSTGNAERSTGNA